MIFKNLFTIVENNYQSLVDEVKVPPKLKKPVIILIFGVFPTIFGFFLGWFSPIWDNLVVGIVSVVSVMTGFSINAIVLLAGHSQTESYELEVKVVEQTKDYTLYAIAVGVFLLSFLILGYVLASSSLQLGLLGIPVYSILAYILLIHYFMGLYVIAHRLYSIVKGSALEDGG